MAKYKDNEANYNQIDESFDDNNNSIIDRSDNQQGKKMSNASRFLYAYNAIDQKLRAVYNLKRSLNFSEVIRKTVQLNSVVRKFEDDLIDYGRLRNAIVHKGGANFVIAEPHEDIVNKMEHIATLISTPPLAYRKIATREVLCVDYAISIAEAMQLMSRSGYSNLPIYNNKTLVGVLNGQRLINVLGFKLEDGLNLQEYITKTKLVDVIEELQENSQYYVVENENLTLERALGLFEANRKLLIILITKNGEGSYPPLGIITNTDIIDIQKVLDPY